MRRGMRRLLGIVAALAAGTWICVAELATNFPAVFDYNDDEIAEQVADGVIVGAALSLFRRQLLLLIQQVPVKLVIVTHSVNMGIHRAFRHQPPYM